MPRKTIARINRIELGHGPIARHLGQDGGRRDRRNGGVPSDHGTHRAMQRRGLVAIHQHQFRINRQRLDRATHGQQRCLKNIQTVDFLDPRRAQRPGQRLRPDLERQYLPACRGKRLGIRQTLDRLCRIQNDRCRDHRASQRAASGFVHAGNPHGVRGTEAIFVHGERRDEHRVRAGNGSPPALPAYGHCVAACGECG